jgi:hypothetical protein
MANVVESFKAETAHECRIAHNNGNLLAAAPHIARECESLAYGDAGASMSTIKHVVWGFGAAREATDAAKLAECAESRKATGEQLVWVGLVPSVKNDAIDWRVHHAMKGNR